MKVKQKCIKKQGDKMLGETEKKITPSIDDDGIQKPLNHQREKNRKRHAQKTFFLSNIKIAPKLLSGFLIIAFLCTTMGIYALVGMNQISETNMYMNKGILLPVEAMSTLSETFSGCTTAIRQALLTDEGQNDVSAMQSDALKLKTNLTSLESIMTDEIKDDYEKLKTVCAQYDQLYQDAITQIGKGQKEQVLNDLKNSGDLIHAERDLKDQIFNIKNSLTKKTTQKVKESKTISDKALLITLCATGLVLILSVTLGIVFARGFSRPIKKLSSYVKKLAEGDTGIELTVYPRKDEIGQMRDAIGTITKSIKELESDTSLLIEAAKEGHLTMRADAQKHQGIYRDIVDGFNTTMDAMIAPIKESTTALAGLAEGNLDTSVTGDFKGDYALIKDAFNSTVETMKRYIDEVTDILEHISRGDMTVGIFSDYKGGFARLKDSINKSIVAFNDVLSEIDTAATQVASGSRQVSNGSQTISQGATEQAAEIDQLTSTVTEIAAQAGQNAQYANTANELVKTAKMDASKGTDQMEKMQKAMEETKAASMSIGKIIKVIDDIAFQTNILALNAAVEAARAGVHGKGFAVVAEEVRNLAARSAQAAKETTELIENSIAIVGSGTKIADETAGALTNIVSGVDKAAELVAQIAVASNEQVIGINQINNSIDQMMCVVQTNSATSEETAAASEELSSQSELLREMVSGFQLRGKSESFLKHGEDVKAIGNGRDKIDLGNDDFGKY